MDSPGTSPPGPPSLADLADVLDGIDPGWRDAEAAHAEPVQEPAAAPAPAPRPGPRPGDRRGKNPNWHEVSRARPCEVCGKPDYCSRSNDDRAHKCRRARPGDLHPRYGPGVNKADRLSGAICYFARRLEYTWSGRPRRLASAAAAVSPPLMPPPDRPDKAQEIDRMTVTLTPALAAELMADQFGLPAFAAAYPLARGVRFRADPAGQYEHHGRDEVYNDREGWVIPEVDGAGGKTVGGSIRLRSPRPGTKGKRFVTGSSRGLTFDPNVLTRPGPIVVVEGASDEFALSIGGVPAVGRLSNAGGVDDLAAFARRAPDREFLIVAERDRKPDGTWPGLAGARHVAAGLVAAVPGLTVKVALMPEPDPLPPRRKGRRVARPRPGELVVHKDPRSYLNARTGPKTSEKEYKRVAAQLVDRLRAAAVPVERFMGLHDAVIPAGNTNCGIIVSGATVRRKDDPRSNLAIRGRCRRWTCPGCKNWLTATAVHATIGHILTAADDREAAWPDALSDCEGKQNFTKGRLYAAVNPQPFIKNRLHELSASWLRVVTTDPLFGGKADILTVAGTEVVLDVLCKEEGGTQYIKNNLRSGNGQNVGGHHVVVVTALSPERAAPPGFVEVGVAGAIRIANRALLSVVTFDSDATHLNRPVTSSHDWPFTPERESSRKFRRTGPLDYSTATAERVYRALGLRTRTFTNSDLAEPAAVGVGSTAASYTAHRLLEAPKERVKPFSTEIVALAERWAAVIGRGQTDGQEFAAYLREHLFDGPPDDARDRLAEIAERDAAQALAEHTVHELVRDIPDHVIGHLLSPVGAFLRELCEFGPEATHHVRTRSLYTAWRSWCRIGGRAEPGSLTHFANELRVYAPTVQHYRKPATLSGIVLSALGSRILSSAPTALTYETAPCLT